ncbi:putative baseplate assembly protein [Paucibacter sp. PLA-PC-4]|uniref:putative baseplate assembly protein n=1 Tax=Paucibacter sp. PLA-PC-4 TaxID=2993655 RepID=UPI00224A6DB3|nr:putative baseplate assembly protein [Paucibacter sp. PLA-PC-4]MCX2864894.1 putative baseplate assembly protein [Paucibacter sp. PLA-PC-4]
MKPDTEVPDTPTVVRWHCGCAGSLGPACACGDGCGCCSGVQALTPRDTRNPPGLPALARRIGTHGAFLQTMIARLSSHALPAAKAGEEPTRPLAALRTRDPGDASIALLDAWATAADVLTFYQERSANEGYLRTATEMRSLRELARLVGYAPRPGVAAGVYLAYTIDANTPQEIVIPRGSRATSVPGQGELPQPFETSQDLRARAAWNQLGLRMSVPQRWNTANPPSVLWLAGTQTRLKAGDPLLIDPGHLEANKLPPEPYRVIEVVADAAADRTAVNLERWDAARNLQRLPPKLKELHDTAPDGKIAAEIVDGLRRLNDGAVLPDRRAVELQRLADLLDQRQLDVQALQAPRLKPWLQAVDAAVREHKAGAVAAKGELADRIDQLALPPTTPRADALQLPRDLASSFRSTSDASLKLLGAAAPGLADSLAPAIAGYTRAAPEQPLRVWALRRTAGLFGRAFPKRTSSVFSQQEIPGGMANSSVTEELGEWPIFSGVIEAGNGNVRLAGREQPDTLYLDTAVDGVAPGGWVFLDASARTPYRDDETLIAPVRPLLVARLQEVLPKVARADYGTSADTLGLRLASDAGPQPWFRVTLKDDGEFEKRNRQAVWDRDFELIRRSVVYLQSELLPLAEAPLTEPLCGGDGSDAIELSRFAAGLEPGRLVIVSGERADIDDTRGVFTSEVAMLTAVVHDVRAGTARGGPWTQVQAAVDAQGDVDGGDLPAPLPKQPGDSLHTFVRLDRPLSYCYRRETVIILGNVVAATHGETRREPLGAGDAARPLQRFDLKQAPLTWLAAPTAAGAASTLEVFVNDVRWHEVPDFVDRGPTERVYTTRSDEQGRTTVQFGNGQEGARLPTGLDNVAAVYRSGIGRPGNVPGGSITQLATRPLGVKEVRNPLPSTGGADAEDESTLRGNVPLAVKSLDRLVSTVDHADFARGFAGIAKADAIELSDGRRSLVHVTVAGMDDAPLVADTDLLVNLRRAMRALGDPYQPVQIAPRELRLLIVDARLQIHPDHVWEVVAQAVRAALLAAFGFRRRALAQGVSMSEVVAVMQGVTGMVMVDLEAFGAIDTVVADGSWRRLRTPPELAKAVQGVVKLGVAPAVQAARARRDAGGGILPAQLVLLSAAVSDTLVLNQIAGD